RAHARGVRGQVRVADIPRCGGASESGHAQWVPGAAPDPFSYDLGRCESRCPVRRLPASAASRSSLSRFSDSSATASASRSRRVPAMPRGSPTARTERRAARGPARRSPAAGLWGGGGRPPAAEAEQLGSGTVLVGFLAPLTDAAGVERLRGRGVVAFAMESVPRITRAQSMDALSSQATVAGYKAVLLAADRSPKMFPLLMT